MYVDNREHDLIKLFPSDQITVKQLPVADIWIGTTAEGEPAANSLLIERKAVADLEASILDGRYREQRARLLSKATEHAAHPVYIIEGDLDRMGHVRLSGQALMKHLTRLQLRYHIAVFQTASLQETAQLLLLLHDQWKSDPTTFEQPAKLSYVEAAGGGKKSANRDDPYTFAAHVLQGCRGISAAAAKAILDAHSGTLKGVWDASAETLAATPVNKRKLGKAVADRLHSLLHGSTD
jgi:ERCC4-type nuclease